MTSSLNALIASDFVMKYVPFGMSKKMEHYRLVDPFCIFFLRFVKDSNQMNGNYWAQNVKSQQMVSWRGIAFENLCFNHVKQIKAALGISGVSTRQSAWSRKGGDAEGFQIDLLIERNDGIINMCEAKYYGDEFVVKKDDYRKILSRQEALSEIIPKKAIVHNTLITTFGLADNEYSGVFLSVITLVELFDMT